MSKLKLIIGNKNYSSWSLRPWIALKVKGVDFTEELSPFDFAAGNPKFASFSPSKKVPVLQDGKLTVWESLAILEYLAERFPAAGLWPEDQADRAWARSIAHEMHGGFSALRSQCPMNMRREVGAIPISEATGRDVKRIVNIWRECLEHSGGPFLFGSFTNADAMFAPVVNRISVYALSDDPVVLRYSEAMTALPAWQEWEAAGKAEPWTVEEEEV
ncbi:glutathione S-transferase family protein [Kiloniella laminariae]|uniref:Glutathione S-transferase family protein n=1 Tax=Kiloniella laminariae TaxID=454162 RepID=A0ABT4LIT7_9PROT|nr:glutathione S-transferase family protein [Kiloniella laminariae]MCZ4281013.1 glutathione S-transferase family protein [Kiloniella laminariae]